MLIGVDPFAIAPFGGGMDGYPLPWYEVCKDDVTWEEIDRIEYEIVRCVHGD
jgi:hypothetical protein